MNSSLLRLPLVSVLAVAGFQVACSASHIMEDAGTTMDARAADDASSIDGGPDLIRDADGLPDVTTDGGSPPVICAGAECATGQVCCFTDGTCFDPDDEAACRADPTEPGGCASNADCDGDELCYFEARLCLGAGVCAPRSLISCGVGAPPVCGCDGRTYENACAAALAGVRIGRVDGACGSTEPPPGYPPRPTPCGSDEDCDGSACCFITGLCLPPDCPDCCFDPPPFHTWPCRTDEYCRDNVDESHRTGVFCDADSCEGPGACTERRTTCDGSLAPVCGCDGITYSNRCWLRAAGVRLAHEGECSG